MLDAIVEDVIERGNWLIGGRSHALFTDSLAMDGVGVKQEVIEALNDNNNYTKKNNCWGIPVIDLDSSDDGSCDSGTGIKNGKRSRVLSNGEGVRSKKSKKPVDDVVLPEGFLDPLPPKDAALPHANGKNASPGQKCKQFWKAGDFEGRSVGDWDTSSGGMDHVRVHPRFLHSNATSHKWVLGAFAELLDNSLDEVCNGATYVKIDMLTNKKDGNRMLLIEDNGGGMDPDKMRQCMSLGYSLKSKVADTIGQYGNGFKTSTMRLGADVIVFSRCPGKDGKRSTQSIGLLSYTFLRSTGKEDIVVPMLDYERGVQEWKKMKRLSASDWDKNIEAIVQWSPFSNETDLLRQFDHMKDQGTCVIIYNLWEDDQGELELDFDTNKHDIQIRGVNRDERNIQMAQQFPNSRHFLTYRHSLRSYASILYLRVPPGFRMILRGKDIEHHNIVNDMMMSQEQTYRPQPGADGVGPKDLNILVAVVTMGFVKDAKSHIDVQGFNVYHKNRLIKPFWRLWNAAGSDGRGVIGVLEANFVEPAHDKQGFERTIVLSRLESKLIQMQKIYWFNNCHKIGYAPRRNKKNLEDRESSPDYTPEMPSKKKSVALERKIPVPHSDKFSLDKHQKQGGTKSSTHPTAAINGNDNINGNNKSRIGVSSSESTSPIAENIHHDDYDDDDDLQTTVPTRQENRKSAQRAFSKNGSCSAEAEKDCSPTGKAMQIVTRSQSNFPVNGNESAANYSTPDLNQLIEENRKLKERLKRKDEEILGEVLQDLESERNRCKQLEAQLEEEKQKCESLNKEQESVIDIFGEERERRDAEEETLRKKLKEATVTIQDLIERVGLLELEKKKTAGHKRGR